MVSKPAEANQVITPGYHFKKLAASPYTKSQFHSATSLKAASPASGAVPFQVTETDEQLVRKLKLLTYLENKPTGKNVFKTLKLSRSKPLFLQKSHPRLESVLGNAHY